MSGLRITAICSVLVTAGAALAQPGPQGGIYSKPYINSDSPVRVGGYADIEFTYQAPAADGQPDYNTFNQHRLVPFFFAEVTPDLHFSAEIEYEYGGNVEKDGEIKVEYLVADYRFAGAFQFRAGIVLTPLGRFNLIHDSPINDLTDRPLVDRHIIPTTLSQAGAGFFGQVYPSDRATLDYEVYLVNGFDEGIIVDTLGTVRIRSGTGSLKEDNNRNKAVTARVNYSPRLGVDIGLSGHYGKYDDSGKDHLTLVAVDAMLRQGPLEAIFEMSQAAVERSHLGLSRQTQFGYYVQGNVHFLQDWLKPGSTFTGVLRWDYVDFSKKGLADDRLTRLTLGVNFRPVEKAVFKTDFQTNWKKAAYSSSNDREDYRFLASVALYF